MLVLLIDSLSITSGKGRLATTGAELLGNLSLRAKHAAAKTYDAIRNSTDDIARIARNAGISEARIARVKDHVFHKLHQLDDGLRRLDPNPRIADA